MDWLHWFLVVQLAGAWLLFINELVYNRAIRGYFDDAMEGWGKSIEQLKEYAEEDED